MSDQYLTIHYLPTAKIAQIFTRIHINHDRLHNGHPCWEWTGGLHPNGYGAINYKGRTSTVHRVLYAWLVGPVPKKGLRPSRNLDHLCRNRRCANPLHLELVSHAENVRRGQSLPAENAQKTHCKRGHPFSPTNTRYSTRRGRTLRSCKRCDLDRKRLHYATNTVYRERVKAQTARNKQKRRLRERTNADE